MVPGAVTDGESSESGGRDTGGGLRGYRKGWWEVGNGHSEPGSHTGPERTVGGGK